MFYLGVVIFLVVFVSFAVMVGISMIVKIWTQLDPIAMAEYNRLKELAKKANEGDTDAIKTCEGDQYNIKSKWWDEEKRFSVRPKVMIACYGHY